MSEATARLTVLFFSASWATAASLWDSKVPVCSSQNCGWKLREEQGVKLKDFSTQLFLCFYNVFMFSDDTSLLNTCSLDGTKEPGHRVWSHSGAHHRGQHDPYGDTHARPVQDSGDTYSKCEHQCLQSIIFKTKTESKKLLFFVFSSMTGFSLKKETEILW